MENSEWYTEALKEGLRQAEEKSKESKKSGRYPWKTWQAWLREELEKPVTERASDEHIALMLQAVQVDAANKQCEMLAMIERHLAQIARKA